MSTIEKEKKKAIEDFESKLRALNGWDFGQVFLVQIFGSLGKQKLDYIKDAVARMVGWHDKQHSNLVKCDYCEPIKQHIEMYKLIEAYYLEFESAQKGAANK
jgi:hypothetical protein